MKTINITGYDPFEFQPPAEMTIIISGKPPKFESDLKQAEYWYQDQWYQDQAEQLYQALSTSLPQATLHRLLIKMLEGHQNLLRIGINKGDKNNV